MIHKSPAVLLAVIGPTASGKTRLAAHLCALLEGEIISADSRQVYRDMNIGTGKDYGDYVVNGIQIPVHLLDIAEAGTRYNLHQFTTDFNEALLSVQSRGKLPVVCGGSGLYLQAALGNLAFTGIPLNEGLRAELMHKEADELKKHFYALPPTAFTLLADVTTVKRLIRAIEICTYLNQNPAFVFNPKHAFNPLIIGLNPSLEMRRQRISNRLKERINAGLIEEVTQLINKGVNPAMLEYYGLEYKFVCRFLQGLMSKEALFELLETAIHQFAKRQMTWFRKMEKDGFIIHWLSGNLSLEEQLNESLLLFERNT